MFPGKDARLYVFRLRTLKRGLEEKQLVRGKCDSRENKLEKTKGTTQRHAELYKSIPTTNKKLYFKFALIHLNFELK